MLFYCVERNYPLFVIKYFVSLGANDDFIFYRGPPFKVSQKALDKAIEMKRNDIIEYLKEMFIIMNMIIQKIIKIQILLKIKNL